MLPKTLPIKYITYRILTEMKVQFRITKLGLFWKIFPSILIALIVSAFYPILFTGSITQDLALYIFWGLILWQYPANVISEVSQVKSTIRSQRSIGPTKFATFPLYFTAKHLPEHILTFVCSIPIVYFLGASIVQFHIVFLALCNGVFLVFLLVYVLSLLSLSSAILEKVILTILQLLFFATPIFWPSRILGEYEYLLSLNPLYLYLGTIREPLLAQNLDSYIYYIIIWELLLIFLIILLQPVEKRYHEYSDS
ncbi:ABC-type polysaccharide/polyol phosphate export system, permease component [Rhodobacteraceae bacterium HIMB11]|nr:ABC-type polysaccharide/polyol phosphate export system, permease component [Rhodobacteraceae bacterium HIMB11]